MLDSVTVQIHEYQEYSRLRGLWIAHAAQHYVDKDSKMPSPPPYEVLLPSEEWIWSSKWVVAIIDGMTDANGWEYASRVNRFDLNDRKSKAEVGISSKYRRRLWSRVRDRERSILIPEVLKRVQSGLGSIHCARVKMELIIRQDPEIVSTIDMIELVMSLKKNICDVLTSIDQVNNAQLRAAALSQHQPQQHSPSYGAVLKKLRNDAHKEEVAIDKALSSSPYWKHRPGSKPKQPVVSSVNTTIDVPRRDISGVRSGRAESFDPSALHVPPPTPGRSEGADSKGLFVDRAARDVLIIEKLVPIDELTVLQQIIDEREVEIKKVHSGLIEVRDMFADLDRLVKSQEIEIQQIFSNVDESYESTKRALEHINKASQHQSDAHCTLC